MTPASNRRSIRHGAETPLPLEALLSEDDPDLQLVNADMAAWHEAHPCDCEAGCTCEEGEGE
jgi:hypothetical protein